MAVAAVTLGDVESSSTVTSDSTTTTMTISPQNTTNNTRMIAMSQRSLDEFQRSASSIRTHDPALSATTVSVSASDALSQLSNTSSPTSKVNITNNALLAALSKQSVQQPHQAAYSHPQTGFTAVDLPSPFFSIFPDELNNMEIAESGSAWISPLPFFHTPAPRPPKNDNRVETSAENTKSVKTLDKPEGSSEKDKRSQTLKQSEFKTSMSLDQQDGAQVVKTRNDISTAIPEHAKPPARKQTESGTIPEQARVEPPPSKKQTERGIRTFQASEEPVPTVSQATKQSNAISETAKKTAVLPHRKDNQVEASAENTKSVKTLDKPEGLSEKDKRSQTVKQAEFKTSMSLDQQDGAEVVITRNETSTAIPEHARLENPPAKKQIERDTRTVQASEEPVPTVCQATKQSNIISESAKKTAVEIDTFTLHETVKHLTESKQETDSFTLHGIVDRLLRQQNKKTFASKQSKNSVRNVNASAIEEPRVRHDQFNSSETKDKQASSTHANPQANSEATKTALLDAARNVNASATEEPRVRRPSGHDQLTSSGTKEKQPSSTPAKPQANNEATKTALLDKTSASAKMEDHVKSEFQESSASWGKEEVKSTLMAILGSLPEDAEEIRQVLLDAVQMSNATKLQEDGANVTAKDKKKIRFDIVEDLPSPTNPDDEQLAPSRRPSVEVCNRLPLEDDISATDINSMLSSDELTVDLNSDEMLMLRRLFPTIGSLVRVTLVPPSRQQSRRHRKQHVDDDADDNDDEVTVMTSSSMYADGPRQTPEDSPSQQNVDEDDVRLEEVAGETLDEPAVVQSVEGRATQTEPSDDDLFRDQAPSRGRAIQTERSEEDFSRGRGPSLQKTQSAARQQTDDVMSLDISSLSSSTDLPPDLELSRQQLSDLQMIIEPRILPRVQPQFIAHALTINNETLFNFTNLSSNNNSTDVDDTAGQHGNTGSRTGPIQLGIAGDNVEDLIATSRPTP